MCAILFRLGVRLSFVPGFKYDLFVSYAHRNDQPWSWVTTLVTTLKQELEAKSRDFSIWWDPALRTGQDFNQGIADAISDSALFLCVLSMAYGDSEYCKKEVAEKPVEGEGFHLGDAGGDAAPAPGRRRGAALVCELQL
jgi:hypothetical protein